MLYANISDLPPAVRRLPPHAQEIFLSAFNNAWQTYAGRDPRQQEEIGVAGKKQYHKRGDAGVATRW